MKKKELTGNAVDAMSDAEKAKLIAELEAETPGQRLARSRPLNKKERAFYERFRKAQKAKRKAGRPRIGKGAKTVAVTFELDLLTRAYAKSYGLKRAQLIAQALKTMMGEATAA